MSAADIDANVKELTANYERLNDLAFVDLKVIERTGINSTQDVKLKEIIKGWYGYKQFFSKQGLRWHKWSNTFLLNNRFFSTSGRIVILFLNRRKRWVLSDILSTCLLYKHYCNNTEKEIIEKIIVDVGKNMDNKVDNVDPSFSEGKYDSIKTILSFISPIIGVFIAPIGILEIIEGLISSDMDVTKVMPDIMDISNVMSIFIFFYLLPLVLQIPILWLIPQIQWYRKIIRISNIKEIESITYDSLLPLQRIILRNAFPDIKMFLDR